MPSNNKKPSKPAQKLSYTNSASRGEFTLEDVDAGVFHAFFLTAQAKKVAVMVTHSRDGAVLGIRLYRDDLATETQWCNGADDLNALHEFLRELPYEP